MMPKGHRSVRSQGYYRLSPVTTPTVSSYPTVSARPSSLQTYYSPITPNHAMSHQQSYTTTSQSHYAIGGPVQHPLASHPSYNQTQPQPQLTHQQPAPITSIRPSSGAWAPQDDQTLMAARAQGMNWAPIQQAYFPSKTPNACRKRHERLMERRNADDWDGLKLENLAKNYMGMRREIWSGLASITGEKWNVVEQKCMSQGLKNLQTSARACARRERMLDTSSHATSDSLHGTYGGLDDSGIDLEAEYDADGGASEHSGASNGFGGGYHHRMDSGASSASGRAYYNGDGGDGSRLPSMDMGIGAIINRPGGGR